MLLSCRVMVKIRSDVWLVSGYAHVFVRLTVIIVTLPVLRCVGQWGIVKLYSLTHSVVNYISC